MIVCAACDVVTDCLVDCAETVTTLASNVSPSAITVAYRGTAIVFADSATSTLRAVNIATGAITTVAGSPIGANGRVDGSCTSATFSSQVACVVSGRSHGELFVCDAGNNIIRQLVTSGGR